MAHTRHQVDQANQGMLLAPSSAEVAFHGVQDEGGVYFRPSEESPAPELTEKVSRLQAEHRALDAIALENRGTGNIVSKTNQANRIENYPDMYGDHFPRLAALGGAIRNSRIARQGLRLESEGYFAESIGIEVGTELVSKTDASGNPVTDERGHTVRKSVIIAKDPSEQARLKAEYRKFREQYAGTPNRKRRDERRKQLSSEIAAVEASRQAA